MHRVKGYCSAQLLRLYKTVPLSSSARRWVKTVFFSRFSWLFPDYFVPASQLTSRRGLTTSNGSETGNGQRTLSFFRSANSTPTFLFISHNQGGGTEYHLQLLGQSLQYEGIRVLVMRPLDDVNRVSFEWLSRPMERVFFDVDSNLDKMVAALRTIGLVHIHVHHLIGFTDTFLDTVQSISRRLNIEYDFTAHDYFSICPRYSLYDDGVQGYCGEPAVVRCNACVRTFGSPAGDTIDVSNWRDRYMAFVSSARVVFAPSNDVVQRLRRYFPNAHFCLRPHMEESIQMPEVTLAKRNDDEPLKVVIVGAIAFSKGSRVILECARDARRRKLPIEFTIVGYTDIDWKFYLLRNVNVTGKYRTSSVLHERLRGGGFHCAFFPAVGPETYSFTLSETLRHGIFPIAFDIGAIGERIRELDYGLVLPLDLYKQPGEINDILLQHSFPEPPMQRINEHFHVYESYVNGYYGLQLAN